MNYIKWIHFCFHKANESNRDCKEPTKEKKQFSEEAFYSFGDLIVYDEYLKMGIMKGYTKRTVVFAISMKIWFDDTRRLKKYSRKKIYFNW